MVCWNLKITLEDKDARDGERRSWECGLLPDRSSRLAAKSPVQLELPLYQAIKDLDEQNLEVKILKRDAGRIELGLEIAFRQRLA